MSKINDLIKEMCPNGVEYKTIDEICYFQNGYAFKSSLFKSKGDILLRITNIDGKKIDLSDVKYIDVFDYSIDLSPFKVGSDEIVIAMSGATTGKIGINRTGKLLYLNQRVGKITPRDDRMNNHFLYHYLLNKVNYFYQLAGGGAQPNLSSDAIKNTIIPIPPIEVQEEIVRILDKFNELEAKLEAELEARKSQYEFWRDKMFKQKGNIEISNLFRRVKGTPITAGKMKEIESHDGKIRIFAGGKTVVNANIEDIPKANIIDYPCVIVQSRGLIDFIYYDKPFTFKNEMWAYTCDNQITVKYLYYYLKNNVNYFRKIGTQMGSIPQISLPVTENFEVYLPSLEAQKRIVNILDAFDKLVNDISEGIPEEIELRKKQYEYYRNKLLNFEELKNE